MDNSSAASMFTTPPRTPAERALHHGIAGVVKSNRSVNHLRQFFAAGRRHKKILRENLPAAINRPTIRRLARRGGVKRIKLEIYNTVRDVVKARLTEIIKAAVEIVEHRKQRTMTALDVVFALRLLGNPIYGCGVIVHGDGINSRASYMQKRRLAHAQNVKDTQRRLGRERHNREYRGD